MILRFSTWKSQFGLVLVTSPQQQIKMSHHISSGKEKKKRKTLILQGLPAQQPLRLLLRLIFYSKSSGCPGVPPKFPFKTEACLPAAAGSVGSWIPLLECPAFRELTRLTACPPQGGDRACSDCSDHCPSSGHLWKALHAPTPPGIAVHLLLSQSCLLHFLHNCGAFIYIKPPLYKSPSQGLISREPDLYYQLWTPLHCS